VRQVGAGTRNQLGDFTVLMGRRVQVERPQSHGVGLLGHQAPAHVGVVHDRHPGVLDHGEHLGDSVVHTADQVADRGGAVQAEAQLAGRRGFQPQLCSSPVVKPRYAPRARIGHRPFGEAGLRISAHTASKPLGEGVIE